MRLCSEVWGESAKTFNIRLSALASACGYWREQGSGLRGPGIGCGTAGSGVVAHALRIHGAAISLTIITPLFAAALCHH